MHNSTNIKIREWIIHILEPQGMGLVLSTTTRPLQKNEIAIQFLTRHIENSLKDTATKPARFRNINPTQPPGICQGILSGRLSLTNGSIELARALYKILDSDERISPADLAVCICEEENRPEEQFLALLKIEHSSVYRHVILQDTKGNTYVDFVIDPLVFTIERLQKSAFIYKLEPRHPDYDLLLLDRQARGQADNRGIARFFSERFLDAELAYDPREHTSRLYKSLVAAQNLVRPMLSLDQDHLLDNSIRDVMNSRRVNLDRWLESLSLPNQIKQDIDFVMRENVPTRTFDLDPAFSTQLVKKAKYTGDLGLKVEVDAENQEKILSVEYIDDQGGYPYYRIVIETREWKRQNRLSRISHQRTFHLPDSGINGKLTWGGPHDSGGGIDEKPTGRTRGTGGSVDE